MTHNQAMQVAELLNNANQLTRTYTADDILACADGYIVELVDDAVVACIEIKRVQWYQCEIRHLCTHPNHMRKGHGTRLISAAERKASAGGARIVQCTIRRENAPSETLFSQRGYRMAASFYNVDTKCQLGVWLKVLAHREPTPPAAAGAPAGATAHRAIDQTTRNALS
jgi:GNAT superfamily N-acetyltransferase